MTESSWSKFIFYQKAFLKSVKFHFDFKKRFSEIQTINKFKKYHLQFKSTRTTNMSEKMLK